MQFSRTENITVVAPQSGALASVSARAAIACDAIAGKKHHADAAAIEYLATVSNAFGRFSGATKTRLPQDEQVILALDAAHPVLVEYLRFVRFVAQSERCGELMPAIVDFLGELLRLKLAPDRVARDAYLGDDGNRFLLREIFLSTVAVLIRSAKYAEVRHLLEAGYSYRGAERRETYSFRRFDGYAKTLDEFRNRRLRLNRLSVSADLVKKRVDKSLFSYSELMEADYILCLRGILHFSSHFGRWIPRTLANGRRFREMGFPLFRQRADFRPLRQILGINSRRELIDAIETARATHKLTEWRIGDGPLDFCGFMGLAKRPGKPEHGITSVNWPDRE